MLRYRQLISVKEFVSRDFDSRYMDFLNMFFPDDVYVVSRCKGTVRKCVCDSCGGKVFKMVGCGKRLLCPRCSQSRRVQLTDRAMDSVSAVMRSFGDLYMGEAVFTLPPNKQVKVDESDLRLMAKVAWDCLRRVLSRDSDWSMRLYAGMVSIQWWHTKKPLDGYYPHIHILLLDRFWDKSMRKYRSVTMHLSKDELCKLRRLWCAEIGKRLVGFDEYRDEYNVYWQYSNNHNDMVRRCSYGYRYPVKDLYDYVKKGGAYQGKDIVWAQRMLSSRSWNVVTWYGWLCDRYKSYYLGLLDHKVLSIKDWIVKRKRDDCLLCGVGKLIPSIGYDGMYHISSLDGSDMLIVYGKKIPVKEFKW